MDTPRPDVLTRRLLGIVAAALVVLLVTAPPVCHAQAPTATVTILHSFGDGSVTNDGNTPLAGVVEGKDGNFYGTTFYGGPGDYGTLFKMTPSGEVTILYYFNLTEDDGSNPAAIILGLDGNFYGVTTFGGAKEGGTFYQMTPSGQETTLYSFSFLSADDDGYFPDAAFIQGSDGNFYGTTYYGGSTESLDRNQGYGTVIKITPAGLETVLHNFGDGSVVGDGIGPSDSLVFGNDGNFYGTTAYGGSTALTDPNHLGYGTVFKITPAGQVTILHSCGDGSVADDGTYSQGGLILGNDGDFYGTTWLGGSTELPGMPMTGSGTIFKINSAGQMTILHSLGDGSVPNDGLRPTFSLIQGTDGNLYGTTQDGGSTITSGVHFSGSGTLFTTTSSGQETILHSFSDGSVPNDGKQPNGVILGTDGALYGTTAEGGSADFGTIFKVTLKAATTINYPAGLQMFSVPYTYPGVDLDGILGYTNPTLATWQPAANDYAITPATPANQIVPGRGYWVRFPQAVSITLPGTPADTTQNFDIPLTKGWNMIGDPFLTTIPVSSLLFNNGIETFAQATTGANPLIGSTVWTYSQSSNQYIAATSLVPEQGDWIFSTSNTDVQVPNP